MNPKVKHIISIINVYAPTSERAKKFPGEIKKMYNDLKSYAEKWIRYQYVALKLQRTLTERLGKGMDQETALVSGQGEEEMTLDLNQYNFVR